MCGAPMSGSQKPLELILARNLLTSVTTPAFLVAREGALLFYNEAAGALLGRPFEDVGQLEPEEWTESFGPLDDDEQPIPLEDLPLTTALRDGPPGARRVLRSRHEGRQAQDRRQRDADRRSRQRRLRRDGHLLAGRSRARPRGDDGTPRGGRVRVKVWGARGSVPAPGPEMNRYGGNTSCVEVTLSTAARR